MSTLILPVAGKSSRFPGMRPKWLLTMPSGKLMYEEAVQGLALSNFERIIVVCLREHIDEYVNFKILEAEGKKNISKRIEYLLLDQPTRSHSETVYQAIKKASITGPIYLKDCDNYFETECYGDNVITTVSLNSVELIDAKNKSYVQKDDLGYVRNIVEKQVISSDFCCGGYGFENASEFASAYEVLARIVSEKSEEIYVSHVIYKMLMDGTTFNTSEARNYIDWGTLREYRHVAKHKLTVFCDIDGVLLENGSKFGKRGWDTPTIAENVHSLVEMQKRGELFLVVTTSRPESEKESVIQKLTAEGLNVDSIICGLPHCKRVLVNDFSNTNPYPTAIAINLNRDSTSLSDHLMHLIN